MRCDMMRCDVIVLPVDLEEGAASIVLVSLFVILGTDGSIGCGVPKVVTDAEDVLSG